MDDLDSGFKRFGSGWRQGRNGFAAHHYWMRTRDGSKSGYAVWKPVLPRRGTYEVFVRIPGRHATSKRATYKIKTTSGWVKRVRSQKKRRGTWLSIGVHRLTTRPVVKLTNKTGERTSRGRRLAFDAVRFVPTAKPAATSSEDPGHD